MKKIMMAAVMALSMACLSAQVMGNSGVRNTLWGGFGSPDTENQKVTFYGFTDTLQARVDVGQFTMEGMINWGFFTDFDCNGSRAFEFTNKTAFYAANRCSDIASSSRTDSLTDPYYVNFLWHPFVGFDVGVGTRLEWKVGPAPACSDYYWGKNAHIKQGGLKDKAPGLTDVSGFVYYPNTYARTAVGLRYAYKNIFEIGFVIPSGISTSGFDFNVGLKIQPMDLFAVSFAYENVCRGVGNLYAGIQLFINKNFTLNVFYAMDNLGNDINSGVNGLGVSSTIVVPSINLTITPEVGFSFFEDDSYSTSFYVGSGFNFAISKDFTLGTWVSWGSGAENKYWKTEDPTVRVNHHLGALSYNTTKNYFGGNVFDIRPTANFVINKNNDITIYADYQSRTAYNNFKYGNWSSGIYWTYTY